MEKDSIFRKMTVTLLLILINVWCFVAISPLNLTYFAFQPTAFLEGKRIWTLITYMFVHGNFWHLLMNMVALLSFGVIYEKILGWKKYLCFYLISGILAGFASVLLSYLILVYFLGNVSFEFLVVIVRIFGHPSGFYIGASGAIFGIAGLLMVLQPRTRVVIIIFPFFSLAAYQMILLVLFGMFFISLFFNVAIGNALHLGGFLTGIFYGLYLRHKHKKGND